MSKATDVEALIEAAGSRGSAVRKMALELGMIKAPPAPKAKSESQPRRRTTAGSTRGPNVVTEGADAETEDDDNA